MEPIRVFIADDAIAARIMLSNILTPEEDIEIVGEASTSQGCIIMLDEANPDIVLLENTIAGGMETHDVVRELKSINPDVKILLSVGPEASAKVIKATEYGASDFFRKPYDKAIILRLIHEAVGRTEEDDDDE